MITVGKIWQRTHKIFREYYPTILFISIFISMVVGFPQFELWQNNRDVLFWKHLIGFCYNDLEKCTLLILVFFVVIKIGFVGSIFLANRRSVIWFDELSQFAVKRRCADFAFMRSWSSVAPMENYRFDSGVVVINGHLYVSGGRWGTDYLTSVECYDPVENTWRSKERMNVERAAHCLVAHKGYLFAIGGYNSVYKAEGIPLERYDPRTDIWTTIPCSPALYGFTRCALRGPDLFIINKSNIYTISNEGSCDNLKLQILAKYKDILLYISPLEWVAIPYQFRPSRNWNEDTES